MISSVFELKSILSPILHTQRQTNQTPNRKIANKFLMNSQKPKERLLNYIKVNPKGRNINILSNYGRNCSICNHCKNYRQILILLYATST